MTDLGDDQRAALKRAEHVAEAIRRRCRPRDPAFQTPGYLRGIDLYEDALLVRVIGNIQFIYKNRIGTWPNLPLPTSFSEKINAFKLLAPIKIPESGNKLLTASFVPDAARGLICVPEIVRRSDEAVLPQNGALPDRDYYLKTNHGSGFVRRVRYPLATEARTELEALATRWLAAAYGIALGEWWYNCFPRVLFLERSVTRRTPSAAILCYVFGGKVGLISIDKKALDGSDTARASLYDPGFNLLAA